jgi:hypothetical protein
MVLMWVLFTMSTTRWSLSRSGLCTEEETANWVDAGLLDLSWPEPVPLGYTINEYSTLLEQG